MIEKARTSRRGQRRSPSLDESTEAQICILDVSGFSFLRDLLFLQPPLCFTLGFHQHEIAEEHHAVNTRRRPLLWRSVSAQCSPYGDYTDMLGLKNSHDKSLPIGIAFGSRVFDCDNLAFSADHVIRRKTRRGPSGNCPLCSRIS